MAGGGLTFSGYDGPDTVSLERRSTHARHRQRWRGRYVGLDTGKLGEYDVKFRVTGSNDLFVIHKTSIEVIHPPAPIIEVVTANDGTISFVLSLSEYAGYAAENFVATCSSGALTYSGESATGEIFITGMRNGLT